MAIQDQSQITSNDLLIHDWNESQQAPVVISETCDETLRDGIQSPSVFDPDIDHKLELIDLMDQLGITIANIGLPGAGPRARHDVTQIARYVRDQRLMLQVNCAARTVVQDIAPIAAIQHEIGIPITAYCFLGTSPIRQLVEDWSLERLKRVTDEALSFALKENLKVAFVTEDTTRSQPQTLSVLFKHAINLGIERLVLCDTVGHATPSGVQTLIAFTKQIIAETNADIKIDWHGHNDRGLAVANALCAREAGAHRLHGTALGVGERVGNTAIDQLIINLKLAGAYPNDLARMADYVEKAANYLRIPLPYNYPAFGKDAFRTATGVHAAAVIKAINRGDEVLANTIYSGVPAHWFGRRQSIELGPMSGASNVKFWLRDHNVAETDKLVEKLLQFAKQQSALMSEEKILELVAEYTRE